MSRSPWTLRHARTLPKAEGETLCVAGGWRGVCVWRLGLHWQRQVAKSADFLKTNKHWDPTKSTRTQASQSTRGRAHAHLCVVALLGGCGWLSLPDGRRESELPPTFVSVRSVVTDLSTCVAYVSAHLKHTCVKSYHNGTFL